MNRIKTLQLNADEDGDTILHFAAADDNCDLIKIYAKLGANIDVENNLGWTPLMFALKNARLKTTKLLLNLGANTSKRNAYGVCCLSIAASSGNLYILQLLSTNNEHIHKTNSCCTISPLISAILYKNIHSIKYLLSKSVSLDCPIKLGGLTPMCVASLTNNKEALDVIRKFTGKYVNTKKNTDREIPKIKIFDQYGQGKNNEDLKNVKVKKRAKKNSYCRFFSPKFKINISKKVHPSQSLRDSVNEGEKTIDNAFENLSLSERYVDNLYDDIRAYALNKSKRNISPIEDLPKIPKFNFSSTPDNEERQSNKRKMENWTSCNLRTGEGCKCSTQMFHKGNWKSDEFQNVSSIGLQKTENDFSQLTKIRKCTNIECFDLYIEEFQNVQKQNNKHYNHELQKFIRVYNQFKNAVKLQNWLSTQV